MSKFVLEGCVAGLESACNAVAGGANRLELCGNLEIGGTTPSPFLFELVKQQVSVPIHVLIRPRFGDFHYSQWEIEVMAREIQLFRQLGCQGVVFGILDGDGQLDRPKMEQLLALCDGLSVTLHRAFDVCLDPYQALEEAAAMGIHSILTSGQRPSCTQGQQLIADLVRRSQGRVDIVVGSGVDADAIRLLAPTTGATSFHMSGRVAIPSPMRYQREGVPMGLPLHSEFQRWQSDAQAFKEAWQALSAGK